MKTKSISTFRQRQKELLRSLTTRIFDSCIKVIQDTVNTELTRGNFICVPIKAGTSRQHPEEFTY